ncbi:hypothetical protein Tco_0706363 [Tanacetum coccineum]|uniref:Uncharacterized protein n=1 Tax=Tanacetum coccineum TaxID=301880 RepID=A0ABQ4Y8S1_9ASTR
MPTTRQGMGSTKIKELIAQSVADAMTAYEANMNYENGVHHETSASAEGVDPTPRLVTPEEKKIERYIGDSWIDIQETKPLQTRRRIKRPFGSS